MAEAAVMNDMVSQNVFDLQIRHLRERADSDEKLSSARFDRIEALLGKTLAEIKMDNAQLRSELKGEIKVMDEHFERKFDVLNERIGRVEKDLKTTRGDTVSLKAIASEMRGDIKALNARLDTQQTKFGWYLTIFGLVITVIVAAIQFWK